MLFLLCISTVVAGVYRPGVAPSGGPEPCLQNTEAPGPGPVQKDASRKNFRARRLVQKDVRKKDLCAQGLPKITCTEGSARRDLCTKKARGQGAENKDLRTGPVYTGTCLHKLAYETL